MRERTQETCPETGTAVGRNELDFMDSREDSPPVSEELARERVRALKESAAAREKTAGSTAHREGTALIEMYMSHVDQVLGYPSFRALLVAIWPARVADAYERMRIARHLTAKQAEVGKSRALLAIEFMKELKLGSVAPLLDDEKPFVLEQPGGNRVAFMEATCPQLDTILGALRGGREVDPADGEALGRTRSRVRGLVEEEPRFIDLAPKVGLVDSEVVVTVRPRGRKGYRLAAEFYGQLAKLR